MFWNTRDKITDDRTFIISDHATYSFSDIFQMGDGLFANHARGVCIIACQKTVETVAAYLGCLRAGIVPLLIDANLASSNIIDLAEKYQAETILTLQTLDLENYYYCGKFGVLKLYQIKKQSKTNLNTELTLLLPTSGSTGDPKCVRLTAKNLDTCTKEIVSYLKVDENRISISALPFHYTYGLSVLHCAIEARAPIVLTELSLVDKAFWPLAEKHMITDFSGVPFMFEVLRRIKLNDTVLHNLKCITQAGGRLDTRHTEYFARLCRENEIDYYTMYGQTEASPRISYVPPERALDKLGSVGIPLTIGKFYTDAEDTVSEGELIYEGPNVCMGHASNRQDLTKADSNAGVLKTGDIAKIDTEGYATIVGRTKRYVKIFGLSVNLDDLEIKLKKQAFDTAVIGADNCIVILTSRHDIQDIRDYIYSVVNFPTRVIKIINVNEIKHTKVGKVDYQEMSKEYL